MCRMGEMPSAQRLSYCISPFLLLYTASFVFFASLRLCVRCYFRPRVPRVPCGLLVLFCMALSVAAGAQGSPRHRTVLVVCDRLTWDHLNAECPFIVSLFDRAAIGLMNTASASPKNATSATLALVTGQQLPAEPADEQAFNSRETVPVESGIAGVVFGRRTGVVPAAGRAIVHLNAAALARRQITSQTLGAILAAAVPPRRILVCGNADTDLPMRRAALLGLDTQATGIGDVALARKDASKPFGLTDDVDTLARYAAQTDADVFVAVLGDSARAEAARPHLTPAAYHASRVEALHRLDTFFLQLLAVRHLDTGGVNVLLISPCPPAVSSSPSPVSAAAPTPALHLSETWTQLTPIIALGPDFAPGLLASPTTRTLGLVANIDIAPTALHLAGVEAPSSMAGRAVQTLPVEGGIEARQETISRLDFVATLNAQALTRVAMAISGLCFALVLAVVGAAGTGRIKAARRLAPGLLFTLNMPVGMLLATIRIPPTLLEYGLRILAWMAALTAINYVLARLLRLPPPIVCGLLTVLFIVVDLLRGQPLLKDSLMSGYALSGIRYYGIGNEYLGIVLAHALLCGFGWVRGGEKAQDSKRAEEITSSASDTVLKRILVLSCWIGLALLLGWPGLGANAGSLIVTGAGFGIAAHSLCGKRFSLFAALLCLLLGIGLSFAFGALDALAAGPHASHAGNVLNASAHGGGAGYLVEIMARKIGMNLRLLISPFFLMGASLVLVLAVLMRAVMGKSVRALFASCYWLRQSLPALAVTFCAALLFKDSGVVMAGFFAGVACLYVLWYALQAEVA